MRVSERAGSANSTRAADESESGSARVSLSLRLNFLDRILIKKFIVLQVNGGYLIIVPFESQLAICMWHDDRLLATLSHFKTRTLHHPSEGSVYIDTLHS